MAFRIDLELEENERLLYAASMKTKIFWLVIMYLHTGKGILPSKCA